jgi:hypothetical protein
LIDKFVRGEAMVKTGVTSTIYALMNLLDAAESHTGLAALDEVSKAVVRALFERQSIGMATCITDVSSQCGIDAAPATLLRRMRLLQDTGWLSVVPSEQHHRRQEVLLTSMALREIARASEHAEKALAKIRPATP